MAEVVHDLLCEPIFTVRSASGERGLSLPGVLAELQTDAIGSFSRLQAHQSHAWHAFLVQLAAIACHRAEAGVQPVDESIWRERLLGLTGGRAEPWALVVAALDRPAFLQPPVPEKSLAGFKRFHDAADEIDILVTGKNHDVKGSRIARARPEHWAYALVSLQTMQGYLGRGNYGIARMNGGFSSRPGFGFVPSLRPGQAFSRDLRVLLEARPRIVEQYAYPETGGIALLWLEPWDGEKALPVDRCDPFFIEICRRVRLEVNGDGIRARFAPTRSARLAAEELLGRTGDPWTPVSREGKALTVSAAGLSYRLLQEVLLSGDYQPGVALELEGNEREDVLFRASVLVRGQGETNGYHERIVPLPPMVRLRLGKSTERARAGKLARQRIDVVGTIQHRVLKPAICTLLDAGAKKLDLGDPRAARWITEHDARVDAIFFDELWTALDATDDEASLRAFTERVLDLARDVLEEAMQATPLPAARRFRALSAAEGRFLGLRHKHFPREKSDGC